MTHIERAGEEPSGMPSKWITSAIHRQSLKEKNACGVYTKGLVRIGTETGNPLKGVSRYQSIEERLLRPCALSVSCPECVT